MCAHERFVSSLAVFGVSSCRLSGTRGLKAAEARIAMHDHSRRQESVTFSASFRDISIGSAGRQTRVPGVWDIFPEYWRYAAGFDVLF
jgi:hypothetical protein